jgi:hypothetical protein
MAKQKWTVEMLESVVGEALGQASMCWTETPSGVFKSEEAALLIEDVVTYVVEGKVPAWHS